MRKKGTAMYKGEISPFEYLKRSAAEFFSEVLAVSVTAKDVAVSKKRGCVYCNVGGRFPTDCEAEPENRSAGTSIALNEYQVVYPFERAENEAGYVNLFPQRRFIEDACRFISEHYEVGEMRPVVPLDVSPQLAHAQLLTYIQLHNGLPACEPSDEFCRILFAAFALAEAELHRGDADALARAVVGGRVNRGNAYAFEGDAVKAMAALLNLYLMKQSC